MRIGIRRDRMAEFELCQEFVEGSSRPEAPLLLAKGTTVFVDVLIHDGVHVG